MNLIQIEVFKMFNVNETNQSDNRCEHGYSFITISTDSNRMCSVVHSKADIKLTFNSVI